MSEYRCSQCEQTYSFDEYRALERAPVDPDEEDPMEGQGFEKVCECGARFHTEKWQLVETVDAAGEEIRVSTVALSIPHGPNHNQWYETCLFHDTGSRVTARYETQSKAEVGHEETVEKLETGAFGFEPTGRRLVLEADDE